MPVERSTGPPADETAASSRSTAPSGCSSGWPTRRGGEHLRAGRRHRAAAADDPPAGPLAGRRRLRAPAAVPALRAGPRPDPARRRGRPLLGDWAVPHCSALVDQVGESANMAVLEGDAVVYVAQVPSPHSMRMFTEVGRRVLPHCTGVGKALLSALPDEQVRAILARTGMPAQTEHTITTPDALVAELAVDPARAATPSTTASRSPACAAWPRPVPSQLAGNAALSVSGPSSRVTARAGRPDRPRWSSRPRRAWSPPRASRPPG